MDIKELSKQYTITKDGNVYSLRKHKQLKGLIKDDGYKIYYLAGRWYYAHRLVATLYKRNPKNKPEVNHIDGNKLNNDISNLEWVTHSENVQRAYDSGQRVSKSGKEHHLYGVKSSEHTKQLQSISKVGVLHPKFKGFYCFNGVRYASAILAAKELGLYSKQVLRWTAANRNGWTFEPK